MLPIVCTLGILILVNNPHSWNALRSIIVQLGASIDAIFVFINPSGPTLFKLGNDAYFNFIFTQLENPLFPTVTIFDKSTSPNALHIKNDSLPTVWTLDKSIFSNNVHWPNALLDTVVKRPEFSTVVNFLQLPANPCGTDVARPSVIFSNDVHPRNVEPFCIKSIFDKLTSLRFEHPKNCWFVSIVIFSKLGSSLKYWIFVFCFKLVGNCDIALLFASSYVMPIPSPNPFDSKYADITASVAGSWNNI